MITAQLRSYLQYLQVGLDLDYDKKEVWFLDVYWMKSNSETLNVQYLDSTLAEKSVSSIWTYGEDEIWNIL